QPRYASRISDCKILNHDFSCLLNGEFFCSSASELLKRWASGRVLSSSVKAFSLGSGCASPNGFSSFASARSSAAFRSRFWARAFRVAARAAAAVANVPRCLCFLSTRIVAVYFPDLVRWTLGYFLVVMIEHLFY